MLSIICKDGKFFAKGSIDLGLAGLYTSDTFEDNKITIMYSSYDELCQALEEGDIFLFEPILPYLYKVEKSETGFAKALEIYYNEKLEELGKHIKEVDNCLWINLFENLLDCSYPFWEIKEAILPEYKDRYDEEYYEDLYGKNSERIYEMFEAFVDQPNNGTVEKPDVEAELRKMFPMFNFDGLRETIKPENIAFSGKYMSFQCSDAWGKELLCGAYDELDEEFTFTDWHNH